MSNQSDVIAELAKALASAQGSMKAAIFNRINPHFKNKYADMAAIWDAIREPLSKNGLSITQTLGNHGSIGFGLFTTLRHTSGQWVSSFQPLPATARPQEFGSALTYARRYSLSALVGIAAEEDDDANTAQKAKAEIKELGQSPTVHLAPMEGARKKYGNPSEDFMENDDIYDAQGNPVDNIPMMDGVEPTTKNKDARSLHSQLIAEIRSGDSLLALELWAKLKDTQIRVASLPGQWQDLVRDAYRTRQNELGRTKS